MSAAAVPSIILIDDKQVVLTGLEAKLRERLGDRAVEIKTWRPTQQDDDPHARFNDLIDENTVLVATDYDLSSSLRGFFGLTVVGWCRKALIPVGDFSRDNADELPKEPDLFEFRIPSDEDAGAAFIETAFSGFWDLRQRLNGLAGILNQRSLAAVLAMALDHKSAESQFGAYMTKLGASNSALLEELKEFTTGNALPEPRKLHLLTYVLGHVLFNSILKYPGPILSEKALAAYFGTTVAEVPDLAGIFEPAKYAGPFSSSQQFFWRDAIDARIDDLSATMDGINGETPADLNRAVIERHLGRQLAAHDCDRCGGVKGGFLCPFLHRPVCLRPDCSVAATSWVPQGAQLCRVEKNFYDEWAPLLGL